MTLPRFTIDLDLSELNELNEVLEHARSGLLARGKAFHKDPKRGHRIVGVVQHHFRGLGDSVQIRLGTGAGSDRFLKAAFAWGHDPDVGGVSAKGITRSRLGKFNKMGADSASPVTGYVFEGVIGSWIVDYLGGKAVDVNQHLRERYRP